MSISAPPAETACPGSPPSSTGISVATEAQAMDLRSPGGDVDTPDLVCMGDVSSELSPSWPAYYLDNAKAKEHVDRIHRFRVLVIGRANAGKTTILQRVCNTTDQPEIFDGEGHKVDPTLVQGSLKRGYHNIEDELVFRSNSRFVFHDSRGFEAGSEEQFDKMKEFVMDRAKTAKLDKRIHAIWYCIPLTDSHRMVTAAETKFFEECDTGHVPVIVLQTKADSLELEAVQQLEQEGLSIDDESREAALAKEILDYHIAKLKHWLDFCRFPPHDYLTLTGMDEEGADCTPLLRCTANALREEGLQKLLISTQQSNLGLCIEYTIMEGLKGAMKEYGQLEPEKLSVLLISWFPYVRKYCCV
ncbi:hypothetical protein BKA82DRAFT_4440820 [Pisolithus tinctorius]|nr:hypothetical protein BKA82DRAFT_4440820 [Pisolithus tinctorius]